MKLDENSVRLIAREADQYDFNEYGPGVFEGFLRNLDLVFKSDDPSQSILVALPKKE